MHGLRDLLGRPSAPKLATVVQAAPALLRQKPARVAEGLADMAVLLALPEAAVVEMSLRKPELLLGVDLRCGGCGGVQVWGLQ